MRYFLPFLLSIIVASPSVGRAETEAAKGQVSRDPDSVIVQLRGEPLSKPSRVRASDGRRVAFGGKRAIAYRAQLSVIRNSFKRWLRDHAPQAQVTGEFDIALNAVAVRLNGESPDVLRGAPMVRQIGEQFIYHSYGAGNAAYDPALGLIRAVEAWQGAGALGRGEGIKVAVIDSGIDISHPCFADAGYPSQTQLGDKKFTNNKVIAAKAFSNKDKKDLSPAAMRSHGTHVAGTVGCNEGTPATIMGVTIPHLVSGVAPRVLLGNYNVFPGGAENTRSEDILDAVETAYEDGFDIANLSLGAHAQGSQDMLVNAINNLDQADMVVVTAAGNDGPGPMTVHSPASAQRALAAGASSVPQFVGNAVVSGTNSVAALAGAFGPLTADLTAPLAVLTTNGVLLPACEPLPAGSLAGKIAVVSRGGCNFTTKVRTVEAAGAVAVLVLNNRAGDPGLMGNDGSPDLPAIPALMVGSEDGPALMALDGSVVTIRSALEYFLTSAADVMFELSARGPTDVDFRVKPDVCAPGVNVLSSIATEECGGAPCFELMNGTSMAAPHLAGSAAVIRALHPTWTAAQIRSALVNTADRNVLKNFLTGEVERDCNVAGSGRENLVAALNASVALDPVSVSFGSVSSGSGQTLTRTLVLRNISDVASQLNLAVETPAGEISYSLSPNSVNLLPGSAAKVTLVMTAAKGTSPGGHQGALTVSSGGTNLAHAVLFTMVK